MGYKQNVLGVQVGATIWMCYKNDVLGCQVGATKRIGYKKDVLGKIDGQGYYRPHVAPVPGFFITLRQRAQPADKARDIGQRGRQCANKKKPSPPAYCQQLIASSEGCAPYPWISMLCPDLNSTVTFSSEIVILSTSLRTSFSSNSVISFPWERMKSCKS